MGPYLVTILSSGRDRYLTRARASLSFLDPPPVEIHTLIDGWDGTFRGMCAAHAEVWRYAAESGYEYVWHQEEDQVLLRPISLDRIEEVLDLRRDLVQMALVRTPWGDELEHGGYIPMAPTQYERVGFSGYEFMVTRRNFSTSPMLARTSLMREFDWPVVPSCESVIGQQILAARPDAAFGLWGWGEPWCAHIGVERAEGSHGY